MEPTGLYGYGAVLSSSSGDDAKQNVSRAHVVIMIECSLLHKHTPEVYALLYKNYMDLSKIAEYMFEIHVCGVITRWRHCQQTNTYASCKLRIVWLAGYISDIIPPYKSVFHSNIASALTVYGRPVLEDTHVYICTSS